MKPGLLREVLDAITEVRITIVGDFCLDAYWFVNETGSEISVETGLPTKPVQLQEYSPGGASNVVNNLADLRVKEIRPFGVIGNDPFGIELVNIFKRKGIFTDNLLVQEKEWSTHVFIKPYVGDKEQSRIDFGNFNNLHNETADRLIERLIENIGISDIVIINQQVYSGIHTEYFRMRLVEVIRRFPDKIFIADSRSYLDYYAGSCRKMNDSEALRLCGIKKEFNETISYREVADAARLLFERFGKPVFITRGSKGSIVFNENGSVEIPGLMILGRTDPVGAGDSYLAGAAAALAAGYPVDVAAELGSFAAGVTVQKLFQCGTASPEEIAAIGTDPDYIYEPETAEDVRLAQYSDRSEIEIIKHIADRPDIRYAIFDNDGTISTLREGWELIMEPMMVNAILGEHFADADREVLRKVSGRVREFIDQTTGIQTLKQMKFLLGLIREFGYVPGDKMLDEFGYKKVYNDELLKLVKLREQKLGNEELSVNDLTVKNAIPFLETLQKKGIKMFLASGTDVEDVRHEASILGYSHFFEDRIFGAVGDLTKEAKRIVLEKILDNIGPSETRKIVTFGDGPVEIRETRKHGGITVGVASNELRRYGLNLTKRTRLIKAGADIIVPDFSQSERLLDLLNLK